MYVEGNSIYFCFWKNQRKGNSEMKTMKAQSAESSTGLCRAGERS